MSSVVKVIETESRMVGTRGWGEVNKADCGFIGTVSVLQDEKF